VPDTQATIADTAAVATVAYELATRIEPAPPAESWKLDQNRWAAGRHGLAALMTDPHTGERATARERLTRALGAPPPELTGARRQREIAAEHGLYGLIQTLAGEFV
jgi:glutamate---cysteine ligase / carboxylate-amine ligase